MDRVSKFTLGLAVLGLVTFLYVEKTGDYVKAIERDSNPKYIHESLREHLVKTRFDSCYSTCDARPLGDTVKGDCFEDCFHLRGEFKPNKTKHLKGKFHTN